jgi:hypothetical protein
VVLGVRDLEERALTSALKRELVTTIAAIIES